MSIKIKRVVSVSSEDQTHKAESLIDGSGKWKCASNADSKQVLIVQLENPSRIRQINIENESSAFIEIMVASADSDPTDESKFEPLLPVVSFMSPAESKNQQNTNRIKRFTDESSMSKELAAKSWEFIKIICTQPFNRNVQFGIQSIKFYETINVTDDMKEAAKINPGVFSLKKEVAGLDVNKESDDNKPADNKPTNEETKKTGSIFAKWKNSEAGKKAQDDDTKDEDEENKPVGSNNLSPVKSKPGGYSKPPKEQILKGVIFALSGFQNPLRSEIRDAGMRLGAKYRPDWTDDCTHLICAFGNTPKVNVAKKAGGKIVTKDWIMDCEKNKVLLDWEGYQLEDDDEDSDDDTKPRRAARNATKKITKLKDDLYDSFDEASENSDDRDFIVNSSDEEDDEMNDDDVEESTSSSSGSDSDASGGKKRKKKQKKEKKVASKKSKKTVKKFKKETKKKSDDESDSEIKDLAEYKKQKEKEAIRKKLQEMKKSESKKTKIEFESDSEDKPAKLNKKESVRSDKTEVNSDEDKKKASEDNDDWVLPSFFTDKTFFIHSELDAKRIKNLTRMIIAFGGNVSNYVTNEVGYVITEKEWNKEFEEGLKENKNLKFVNPDWIDACNRRKKLMAYQPFEIFPLDD